VVGLRILKHQQYLQEKLTEVGHYTFMFFSSNHVDLKQKRAKTFGKQYFFSMTFLHLMLFPNVKVF